ncbi:hypothetical protein [Sorangium sp. So ce1099]|uniref:hypothetical protein n=1 Tax=Sorangium sp. So ce1099 TaxID=3133331 RepID=UPI003F5E77E8
MENQSQNPNNAELTPLTPGATIKIDPQNAIMKIGPEDTGLTLYALLHNNLLPAESTKTVHASWNVSFQPDIKVDHYFRTLSGTLNTILCIRSITRENNSNNPENKDPLPLLVTGTITATYTHDTTTLQATTNVYVCTNPGCDPKKAMVVYGPDGDYWFIDMTNKGQWSLASLGSGPGEIDPLIQNGTVVTWLQSASSRSAMESVCFLTCFVLNMDALTRTIPPAKDASRGSDGG